LDHRFEAGLTVEFIRASRYHDAKWGDQLASVIDQAKPRGKCPRIAQ
jgi:hypothetical protein